METSAHEFIEKVAVAFESMGIPRSAGRIVGWLLLSDGPQTMDDLVVGLGLGRATASMSARLLETAGIIQRVRVTGDRRLFYQMSDDAWFGTIQRTLTSIRDLRDLAREGLRLVDGQSPAARSRLASLESLYTTLFEKINLASENVAREWSDRADR